MKKENDELEYKREYVDDVKKTVVAFANSMGGLLRIGVTNDLDVIGVKDSDDVLYRVVDSISKTIKPDVMPFVACKATTIDGKEVVDVEVQRGTKRPYYLGAKGPRPEGVFIRKGASSVPASEAQILQMIKESSEDFESAISLRQDLTFDATQRFFKRRDVGFGEPQMKTLGLINADDAFTNLALILSDQTPYVTRFAEFDGCEKRDFKDRREFDGPLFQQLENIIERLDKCNRTRGEVRGLFRVDFQDYAAEALREAVLNAFVHRDYAFSEATSLYVFDDRIEIVSIGGIAVGFCLEDILNGVSALRNKRLCNVFLRLGLIEAYGTGIGRIVESYNGLPVKPDFIPTNNSFRTILPNRNWNREKETTLESFLLSTPKTYVDKRVESVLKLASRPDGVTRKELEEELNVSAGTVGNLLRKLREEGLLHSERSGRTARYFVK